MYNQEIPKPHKWRLIVCSRPILPPGFQTPATRNWPAKTEKSPPKTHKTSTFCIFYMAIEGNGYGEASCEAKPQLGQLTKELIPPPSLPCREALLSLTFMVCSMPSPTFSNTIHHNFFCINASVYYIPSSLLLFTLFSKTILCIL